MFGDLPFTRLAPNLQSEIANLSDPGRAHRMPLRLQSTAGIHRPWTIQRGAALQRIRPTFALLDEIQVFRGDDFRDGEAIVQFGELDILRGYSRHLVCFLASRAYGAERRDIVLFVQRNMI